MWAVKEQGTFWKLWSVKFIQSSVISHIFNDSTAKPDFKKKNIRSVILNLSTRVLTFKTQPWIQNILEFKSLFLPILCFYSLDIFATPENYQEKFWSWNFHPSKMKFQLKPSPGSNIPSFMMKLFEIACTALEI